MGQLFSCRIHSDPSSGDRLGGGRGAFISIYGAVVMSMLLTMMLLAVDWGHVQLAKTDIMGAAIAAARAGVGNLAQGKTQAVASAIANAIQCTGQTIPLPAGDYKSVVLIVVQGYGPVTSTVTLSNADATTTAYTQSFSDWCLARPTTILNENVLATLAYRNVHNGSRNMQTNYLLSYEFPITSAAGVSSVKLPVNSNLNVLAIGLTPAEQVSVR